MVWERNRGIHLGPFRILINRDCGLRHQLSPSYSDVLSPPHPTHTHNTHLIESYSDTNRDPDWSNLGLIMSHANEPSCKIQIHGVYVWLGLGSMKTLNSCSCVSCSYASWRSVLTLRSLPLSLHQRGLVQDLCGCWLRFLCGDEPRRSTSIHREEDESAHSVSSNKAGSTFLLLSFLPAPTLPSIVLPV